jgi:hypothetical protein
MSALHMGSLHAIEVVLVVVLAVGPFLALAAAIVVARRRDRAEDVGEHDRPGPPHEDAGETENHPRQENSWC